MEPSNGSGGSGMSLTENGGHSHVSHGSHAHAAHVIVGERKTIANHPHITPTAATVGAAGGGSGAFHGHSHAHAHAHGHGGGHQYQQLQQQQVAVDPLGPAAPPSIDDGVGDATSLESKEHLVCHLVIRSYHFILSCRHVIS
jgi:hypothetical protein